MSAESAEQGHVSRRIRSSSSDAATVRCVAGETDLISADDSCTQPRRISDPVCHAAETTYNVLGHVVHTSTDPPPHPQLHITTQRRRLEYEEVQKRLLVE